jgi:hypothetical protein
MAFMSVEHRKRLLLDAYKRGLDDEKCIGYQGTSIETLEHMLDKGGIPGHTGLFSANKRLPQLGDLYFYPRLSNFPKKILPELFNRDGIPASWKEFAADDSAALAAVRAAGHFFAWFLNLDLAEFRFHAECYVEDYPQRTIETRIAYKKFKKYNLSNHDLAWAVYYARKRSGVVLGLSEEALEVYPPTIGDGGDDFRINVFPRGLDPKYLAGIAALGEQEKAWFSRLEKSLGGLYVPQVFL